MTIYRLDVYDTAGVKKAELTDYLSLYYSSRVNTPGVAQFGLAGTHRILSDLADKWEVEIWRKPSGGADWARDYTAIYRTAEWAWGEAGPVLTAICQGLMTKLRWRHVAWKTGTANRSAFQSTAAETIAKTLVTYNAGSSALASNGRLRDGAISGLTVDADGAGGDVRDWYCAYDNLLESIQDLALISGGDFDLVRTSSTTSQFRWYAGQLGTDRRTTVRFSMEFGNMQTPRYVEARAAEQTVAIVGGMGDGAGRKTAIALGDNYDVSANNIEMFVNASNTPEDGLADVGARKLQAAMATTTFEFDVIQTPGSAYGIDYFLGDLVTAVNPYNGDVYERKISGRSVRFEEDGSETIGIELGEIL